MILITLSPLAASLIPGHKPALAAKRLIDTHRRHPAVVGILPSLRVESAPGVAERVAYPLNRGKSIEVRMPFSFSSWNVP